MQALERKKGSGEYGDPQPWLKKILTKKEIEHIKFRYLRNGVLGVAVDSSAWLYHLSLKERALVEKLRPTIRGIKAIKFRLGKVK
jgi:hypothetical protein